MLLGNIIKITDMIIRKGVPFLDALKILIYYFPYLLSFTLPLSFLLGTLLSTGRLVADNEILAINVAGIPNLKILKILLIVAIIFSLFLFILNDKILPYFHYTYRRYLKTICTQNISALIEPGVFMENFKNVILYVQDREENKLKNIFVYEIDKQGVNKVTFARKGEFVIDGEILKMKLENGFTDEVNPKNKDEFYRLNFKVFFMDLPFSQKEETEVEKKTKDLTLNELKRKIRHLQKLGIKPLSLISEFQRRLSLSFSPITFILLGFGISFGVRHREKSINFGIAFLIWGVYYLFFILGEALTEFRILPPWLGMWLANIVTVGVGIYFIYKYAHIR